MSSENNLYEATNSVNRMLRSCAQTDAVFFGTEAMMNLCSCRDHKMTEEQAAMAKAAVEKSMSSAPPSSPSPKVLIFAEKVIEEPPEPPVLILGPSSEEPWVALVL